MSLTVGTKLGVFEILSPLGAGGMGEVYRAHDTKLGREVAVKVLPEMLAADPDRIARFQREAKSLAALNHPHIAALYGMEESGGCHFLIMELVEGETLAEQLLSGPLPLERVLEIAQQISEALEAAHEKGIIHRDLKPANVKLTPEEKVKVLDFGLAKALENPAAGTGSGAGLNYSPTLSLAATQAGVILGTAAYMSPEQAKGLPADHRSDVFSFGVVLYEMLTGRKPFQGDTAPDILASVLARDPDLSTLPQDVNPRLSELVKRCLEKNPKRRWQAIGDVRAEIETIAANPRTTPAMAGVVTPIHRPLWQRAIPVIIGMIVASALTAAAFWNFRSEVRPVITKFPIVLGDGQIFTTTIRRNIAISRDGTSIAYVANNRLYLRSMSELEARPILGTEQLQAISDPTFSPDGRWIAFWASSDATIKKISVLGGAAITICPLEISSQGITWDKETIIFGDIQGNIMKVSANGGKPEVLVQLQVGKQGFRPYLLPDRETIIYTEAGSGTGPARVVAQSSKTGERKILVEGGVDGAYLSTGHLVYASGGVLMAVPFDVKRLALSGGPTPIVEGVRRGSGSRPVSQFSISDNGTLIYVPGPATAGAARLSLSLFDSNGRADAIQIQPGPYQAPRVSPDGKHIAFGTDDEKDAIVWIYDVSNAGAARRLTFGGRNRFPTWSSDSQRVAFQSDREGDSGIFWQRADGTGTAERLTRADAGTSHVPQSWSPNGGQLLFDVVKDPNISLWIFTLQDKKVTPFSGVESATSSNAAFSPDGRWVAYSSRENSARTLVYVQPFPPTGAKYQISKNSEDGHHPVWAPDGTKLFYTPGPGAALLVVGITTKPTFTIGNATPVARPFMNAPPAMERPYDIAHDGKRFLGLTEAMETQPGTPSTPRINVVLNWFEELKQRVPIK